MDISQHLYRKARVKTKKRVYNFYAFPYVYIKYRRLSTIYVSCILEVEIAKYE